VLPKEYKVEALLFQNQCAKYDFQVNSCIPIVYFRFVDGVYQHIWSL